MIYSAFEEIPTKDITLSFVATPKPIKLFDHLINGRGLEIEEVSNGIYYVKGDTFEVQIIESKRLTADENVFLKNLRSSLTKMDMQEVFETYRKYGISEKVNIYLSRVLGANQSTFEEVIAMTDVAVRNIILKQFEKDGTLDKIREDKARDAALEMLKDGVSPDKAARYLQMPLEWVQSLKE